MSSTIPDAEIQQIAKNTLAARHKRSTMEEVGVINDYNIELIMLFFRC